MNIPLAVQVFSSSAFLWFSVNLSDQEEDSYKIQIKFSIDKCWVKRGVWNVLTLLAHCLTVNEALVICRSDALEGGCTLWKEKLSSSQHAWQNKTSCSRCVSPQWCTCILDADTALILPCQKGHNRTRKGIEIGRVVGKLMCEEWWIAEGLLSWKPLKCVKSK